MDDSYCDAGTSVGAQYREATRAKSNADLISRIEGSLQELEESEYWLELIGESGFIPEERLAGVKKGNRRAEGNIRQYRAKDQAKSKNPEF